jgi:hypothetical protein
MNKIKYYIVVRNEDTDNIGIYKAESEDQVRMALIQEIAKDFGVEQADAELIVNTEFTIEEIGLINLVENTNYSKEENFETRLTKYLDASKEERQKILDDDPELWFFLNSIEYVIKLYLTDEGLEIPILDRLIKEIEKKENEKEEWK